MSKAEYLVVDSGGFIKNAPLREIASHVVTLRDVVDEIRDKPTRQRLQVLPYELEFRQPTSKGLKVVTEFSKKTGDYGSLSMTDLNVLAVTYDLEVEQAGSQHLNSEPVTKRTVEFYKPTKGIPVGDKKIAGFYEPEDKPSSENCDGDFSTFQYWREPIAEVPLDFDVEDLENLEDNADSLFSKADLDNLEAFLENKSFLCSFEVSFVDLYLSRLLSEKKVQGYKNLERWHRQILSYNPPSDDSFDLSLDLIKAKISLKEDFCPEDVTLDLNDEADPTEQESSDEGVIIEDYDSDNMEDDDGGEWITPSNLKDKKIAMAGTAAVDVAVKVACITTDFAMQNVLKQIGLNIIGANGMIIKETKTWILRCYACFKTTPFLDQKFCPKCGNKTLKRVSVTLNADGSQQIHISTRRPISTKGKKYSLPAPKGGKHSFNPRLVADQRDAQQRLSRRAILKNNPMDPDFIAGSSPFLTKDVTSKSAMLGLKGPGLGQAQPTGVYWTKKNPNSGTKNTGNKRKK